MRTPFAVASDDAADFASAPALPRAGGATRPATSFLLVLFSLILLALPALSHGAWSVGFSAPISTHPSDGVTGQGESPSPSASARPETDEALTLWTLPASRAEGAPSAPTLRGRSALSLGISAAAPLHRPPRFVG